MFVSEIILTSLYILCRQTYWNGHLLAYRGIDDDQIILTIEGRRIKG